jgi:hypothetical protein
LWREGSYLELQHRAENHTPGFGALTVGGHVVPKHRRSDDPSLVSVGAPVNRTEYGLDAGYYPAPNGHSRAASEPGWAEGPDGYNWQEWQDWHDWAPPAVMHPDHPSAPVPRVQFPADHPSGPYAIPRGLPGPGPAGAGGRPAPAGQDLLRPLPPALDDHAGSRRSAAQSARGPGQARGSGRHQGPAATETGSYVAAAIAGAAAGQVYPDATRVQREPGLPRRDANGFQREPGLPRREANGFQREPGLPRREANGFQREPGLPRREANGFQREPGLARRDANGFQREPGLPRRESAGSQRQASPGWQETTDYRRETGPFGPGPGPASGRYQNGRSAGGDSLSRTGQLRALGNGGGVQVAQEAHDDAAAIREAAQLEAATITQHATGQAAAIREAAEREAAELRARLDSMLGELNRIAPSVTGSVAAPARPATAPALPDAEPALPGRTRALPATAPALPGAEPGLPRRPSARPTTTPARSATKPGTRSAELAKPRTTSARQSDTRGRQARAMRVFVWATAAALAFAAVSATTEIAEHGLSFFLFREGATGETGGTETDQQFEAQQKAAAHPAAAHKTPAPTGKHHKTTTG